MRLRNILQLFILINLYFGLLYSQTYNVSGNINELIKFENATLITQVDYDNDIVDDILYIDGSGNLKGLLSQTMTIDEIIPSVNILSFKPSDLTYDGNLDIAYLSSSTGNTYGSIKVFDGLQSAVFVNESYNIQSFTIGDVNNDMLKDIIFIDKDGDIFIRYDAPISSNVSIKRIVVSENAQSVSLGDLNSDNIQDVVFTDVNGNIKGFSTATVITPPNISSLELSPTSNKQPKWSWSSSSTEGSGIFSYSLDGGSYSDPLFDTSFIPSLSLQNGSHTLSVRELGNNNLWSSSNTHIILIIDELKTPLVLSEDAPLTNDQTPKWTWISESGVVGSGVFRYRINNSSFSPETTTLEYTPSVPFEDGLHTLYVQEKSTSGVWSEEGSLTVEISSNKTDGVSGVIRFLSLADGASSIRKVDYDGDGSLDIIYINNTSKIKLYQNGQGVSTLYDGGNVNLIETSDYDVDNRIDIVFVDDLGNLNLYTHSGEVKPLLDNHSISNIKIKDFDNDGDEDVVFIDGVGDIRIHYNDTIIDESILNTTTFETLYHSGAHNGRITYVVIRNPPPDIFIEEYDFFKCLERFTTGQKNVRFVTTQQNLPLRGFYPLHGMVINENGSIYRITGNTLTEQAFLNQSDNINFKKLVYADGFLAFRTDGKVFGWGGRFNYVGVNIGDNPPILSEGHEILPLSSKGFTDFIAAQNTSYALDENGVVWSWARDILNGGMLSRSGDPRTPGIVSSVENIVEIKGMGSGVFFARSALGKVYSWGRHNQDGILGHGSSDSQLRLDFPTEVSGITSATSITVDEFYHNAVFVIDGDKLKAWGPNNHYLLGTSFYPGGTSSPMIIPDINAEEISKMAIGKTWALMLKRNGNVFSWGLYNHGALGIYYIDPQDPFIFNIQGSYFYKPVQVPSVFGIRDIKIGFDRSFLLK